MEKFVKQFKTAVLILVVGVILFVFSLTKIFPQVGSIIKGKIEYGTTSASLKAKQAALETAKEEAAKPKQDLTRVKMVKDFYIPVESGLDKEAVIAGEFADVLKIMREFSVKARSVDYDYDPADDNFYANASDKYNVAEVEMDLVANYNQFKNFLIEIFKHEHFINIVSIEIQPYSKNKRILLIRFTMRLYGAISPEA